MDSRRVEEWFQLYGDTVYTFLVYYCGCLDVDDIVQDTFLRAMKAADQLRMPTNPRNWLLTIARNLAVDRARKQKSRRQVSDNVLADLADFGRSPEELAELRDTTRYVLELAQNLNPNFRAVLILRGINGLTPTETAEVLSWSVSKVNVTYFRAVRAVRRLAGVDLSEGGLT